MGRACQEQPGSQSQSLSRQLARPPVRPNTTSTAQAGSGSIRPESAEEPGQQGQHEDTRREPRAGHCSPHQAREAAASPCHAREVGNATAYGLGVSLVGDNRALDGMLERQQKIHQDHYRGEFSLALGLMGSATVLEDLVLEMAESEFHPVRYEHAAVARALLQDDSLHDELIAGLKDAQAWPEAVGCARALGWVGEANSVGPLLGLLEDEGRTVMGRANAVRALGWICDRAGKPWALEFARGLNYAASPPRATKKNGKCPFWKFLWTFGKIS